MATNIPPKPTKTESQKQALDFKNCFRVPLELEARLVMKWFGENWNRSGGLHMGNLPNGVNAQHDLSRKTHNMPFLNRTLVYMNTDHTAYRQARVKRRSQKSCWYSEHFSCASWEGVKRSRRVSKKNIANTSDMFKIIRKLNGGSNKVAGPVVIDVDSNHEVVEILSSDEISVSSSSVQELNMDSFPPYDPEIDGLPKKCKKANTMYFRSIRKSVKEEILKHFSSIIPSQHNGNSEDTEQKLQYLVRLRMKKMWYGLKSDKRKFWEKQERCDKNRFEYQTSLYQEWYKKRKRTLFHFVSFSSSEQGQLEDYTETRLDKRCSFCLIDCRNDKGLLAHCSNIHLSFSFEGKVDKNGHCHVRVSPVPFFNLKVKGRDDMIKNDFFYCKSFSQRPKPCILTSYSTEVSKLNLNRPIRQYYHPRTMEPMKEDEWDEDSDDDDELDSWRIKRSDNLLSEFEDVSAKEKIFMKLWNRYISSNHCIPDKEIPDRCIEFIQINHSELRRNELRDQLILHLFNFWDHILISSSHILKCLDTYDVELGAREEIRL